MRILRFSDLQGQEYFGLDQDTRIGDSVAILTGDIFTELKPTGEHATLAKLLAPLTPCNIYCIGLNYREHAAESGMEEPKKPIIFAKPTSSLCHPDDPIRLPACQHEEEVDYECELAVIIGKTARDVSVENALNHVLGYTCANDVSARKWQLNAGGGQWIRGKGFDTFCPLGPLLVTKDEIPDPQDLSIKTHLNGKTVQDHTTGDMIFSVAEIISFLSQDTTLLPGTAILTGTPQGVGFARKPPIWLRPGDEVKIEIENIGILTNPVIAPN
jgi:2-keto-4-pentenoate hydratase/2-oxohepta-3-ene-1,7-dioic acid hydratase in catechol pathway